MLILPFWSTKISTEEKDRSSVILEFKRGALLLSSCMPNWGLLGCYYFIMSSFILFSCLAFCDPRNSKELIQTYCSPLPFSVFNKPIQSLLCKHLQLHSPWILQGWKSIMLCAHLLYRSTCSGDQLCNPFVYECPTYQPFEWSRQGNIFRGFSLSLMNPMHLMDHSNKLSGEGKT